MLDICYFQREAAGTTGSQQFANLEYGDEELCQTERSDVCFLL